MHAVVHTHTHTNNLTFKKEMFKEIFLCVYLVFWTCPPVEMYSIVTELMINFYVRTHTYQQRLLSILQFTILKQAFIRMGGHVKADCWAPPSDFLPLLLLFLKTDYFLVYPDYSFPSLSSQFLPTSPPIQIHSLSVFRKEQASKRIIKYSKI